MANTEKVIVQVVVKGEKDLKSINKTTEKSTKSFTKLASQIATATLAYQAMSKAVSSVVGTFKSFECARVDVLLFHQFVEDVSMF